MTREYIRIAELIYKDQIGIANEEEKKYLEAWRKISPVHEEIVRNLSTGKEWGNEYESYRNIRTEKA